MMRGRLLLVLLALVAASSPAAGSRGRFAALTKANVQRGTAADSAHAVPQLCRRPLLNSNGTLVREVQLCLFWLSTIDAVVAVARDDYDGRTWLIPTKPAEYRGPDTIQKVYNSFFYFAKLRPRVVFSVGALVRALQLCTPIHRILNPSAGVGAGVNLAAMVAKARWVSPFVLGWSTTRRLWTTLGAAPPKGPGVPITVSSVEGRLAGVPVTVSVVNKDEGAKEAGEVRRGGGAVAAAASDLSPRPPWWRGPPTLAHVAAGVAVAVTALTLFDGQNPTPMAEPRGGVPSAGPASGSPAGTALLVKAARTREATFQSLRSFLRVVSRWRPGMPPM
uniref:Uncharacterized protein n=1 Tax=Florenciella parvula TaxID=236787 RepID=A0A7S2CCL2_9STRA|mmetsp:Transcript_27440/g.56395  ORF Transcript_27440/g.56395 Transcript_27440/m.56395 type:complete len:334 (+) Transcript_27440:37-1038(+)